MGLLAVVVVVVVVVVVLCDVSSSGFPQDMIVRVATKITSTKIKDFFIIFLLLFVLSEACNNPSKKGNVINEYCFHRFIFGL